MSDELDIEQVIRTLRATKKRHDNELQAVRADYVQKLYKLQEKANLVDLPELPPLENDEYYHFEYVEWTPVEDGGYYSNTADLADTREKALSKLRELIGSKDVYAVHVRRFPMKEQGAHVYDERKLSQSQSNAYMQRLRADKLDKAYEELRSAKAKTEAEFDQAWARQEDGIEARDVVIDILLGHIEAAYRKLKRDNDGCCLSDAIEYMKLLTPHATAPGDEWVSELRRKALTEVRRRRENRSTRDLMKSVEKPPCDISWDNGERCAGTMGHPGDCTPNADDIPSEQEDKAVECDCGVTWKDGVMGPGHGDMQCYAMETPCRVCTHPEDRHTRSLPEEGNQAYCTECGYSDEYHEFDGSKPDPEDICNCGCRRKNHQDENALGGAQCKTCPGSEDRAWRHGFMMRTD